MEETKVTQSKRAYIETLEERKQKFCSDLTAEIASQEKYIVKVLKQRINFGDVTNCKDFNEFVLEVMDEKSYNEYVNSIKSRKERAKVTIEKLNEDIAFLKSLDISDEAFSKLYDMIYSEGYEDAY